MGDVKGNVMAEEVIKPGETPTAETVTAETGKVENNNGSNNSEVVQTQNNGNESAANKRIRQLIADNKALEAKLSVYAPESTTEQGAQVQHGIQDVERKLRIEFNLPETLKNQKEGILAFATKHPTLTPDEVIQFFKPSNQSATQELDDAARNSATGGNPVAKPQGASGLKDLKNEDLEAELRTRLAAGEKI